MNLESLNKTLQQKLSHCQEIISRAGKLAIGFSGGVDSTMLLALAIKTLGSENVLAVTATGLFHSQSETSDARSLAQMLGANLVEISLENLDEERVLSNPADRCYWCKRHIFSQIGEIAAARGIFAIASGSNLDDLDDYRPGSKAEIELNVVKPLQQAGLTKQDIREISQAMDLPTASKPSKACLASRVPYGIRLTPELFTKIELAEQALIELGFVQCRVRDHQTVARIEITPSDFPKAIKLREEIVRKLKSAGYQYISLDLQGFRSGAMNETL